MIRVKAANPREGNGTPLQYSCLENPMDGGAWWAAVHGVVKSWTRLSDLIFHFSLSCIGEGNGNPLPGFLPGESQGRGSLVGCRLWGRTESSPKTAGSTYNSTGGLSSREQLERQAEFHYSTQDEV